ncbi:hypothetical protein [Anaeromyxobacter sp. SG17]|uniref:hypothetical protein n=1 Tax=Anaeromyxobacter sp. SG17 TaxID=2925405 RepID=UPI001F58A408|nr:hypothetical protein [Anaeromyxobacter sp. SG17]
MNWSQRVRTGVFGCAMGAMLTLPTLAAAHLPPSCPETWNPAAQPEKFDGVPGGWSTAPGTKNEATPQNPDGFFLLQSADGHGLKLYNGCPGIGGVEDGNGDGEQIDALVVPDGTAIKYTEANGKAPGWKRMAGSKSGNPHSDYVYVHVWGQGDLWICDEKDATACTCCYVPPPPFTPPAD